MKDLHHILHNRQEWSLRPEARRLRESRTLIPELDRRVHEEIHVVCPPVPLLGYYALRMIDGNFEEGRDTLQSMDNLMRAIDLSANHPRAHRIERGMADLAIEAIELQRPWILDGTRHLGMVA